MITIKSGSGVPWGTPPQEADDMAAATKARPFSVKVIPSDGQQPYVVHYVAASARDKGNGFKAVGMWF